MHFAIAQAYDTGNYEQSKLLLDHLNFQGENRLFYTMYRIYAVQTSINLLDWNPSRINARARNRNQKVRVCGCKAFKSQPDRHLLFAYVLLNAQNVCDTRSPTWRLWHVQNPFDRAEKNQTLLKFCFISFMQSIFRINLHLCSSPSFH